MGFGSEPVPPLLQYCHNAPRPTAHCPQISLPPKQTTSMLFLTHAPRRSAKTPSPFPQNFLYLAMTMAPPSLALPNFACLPLHLPWYRQPDERPRVIHPSFKSAALEQYPLSVVNSDKCRPSQDGAILQPLQKTGFWPPLSPSRPHSIRGETVSSLYRFWRTSLHQLTPACSGLRTCNSHC